MKSHLRVAKPVADILRTQRMYCSGLGLSVVGSFENHEGFDGVMLGSKHCDYHFEFTVCRHHPVVPVSTPEDVVVFYIPDLSEWESRCAAMVTAGFKEVKSFNPYWDMNGKTFQDLDGYRIVIQNDSWSNSS